jgi:DNA (cytosine-5)-methyltransferase 1
LADVVADHWAPEVHPRVIIVENVPEFVEWGPLDEKGRPIKKLKGVLFKEWVDKLKVAGYSVEWRNLTACDYGVPTSRMRFFLIARCDGQPIVWPKPTHGPGLLNYHTAAECIDFSLPCPSIFLTQAEAKKAGLNIRRPLKENTLRRIALGLKKFVFENPSPFIVQYYGQSIGSELDVPMPSVTGRSHHGLVMPFLTKYHGSRSEEADGRGQSLGDPLLTQDTRNRFGLVSTFLTKFYGTNVGSDLREPLPTVTGQGQHLGQVNAFLVKYYGTAVGQDLREPLHTVTSRDRLGLVTVRNELYRIADIGLRMLTPQELLKAHAFPKDYVLVGTRSSMVARIGNSVPPEMSRVLVAANVRLKELESVKSA